MARLYAQLFTVVFVLVGLVGLLLAHGGGNLGGLTLHLTWARDILDLVVAAVLALLGFTFRVARQASATLVTLVGALLIVLAVAGFATGDGGFAGLHFAAAVNVLDLLAGVLGVLCGVVTLADQPDPA
jgi:hypothetical protein